MAFDGWWKHLLHVAFPYSSRFQRLHLDLSRARTSRIWVMVTIIATSNTTFDARTAIIYNLMPCYRFSILIWWANKYKETCTYSTQSKKKSQICWKSFDPIVALSKQRIIRGQKTYWGTLVALVICWHIKEHILWWKLLLPYVLPIIITLAASQLFIHIKPLMSKSAYPTHNYKCTFGCWSHLTKYAVYY